MQQRTRELPKWLPYVAPLVLFLVFTSFEQLKQVTSQGFYPSVYTAKIVILTLLLWLARGLYPELKRNGKGVALGLLLGPLLTAAWVIIDHFTPHFKLLGSRSAFNPFEAIPDQRLCWLFIVIRLFGITAIAPIIEEFFYRAFLLRFVIKPDDFTQVPLGQYDLTAFIVVVVLMASAHPEYLAAAVFSAAMNLLLFRTKNLCATIAAHASTNFWLAIYVLYFHAWKYW